MPPTKNSKHSASTFSLSPTSPPLPKTSLVSKLVWPQFTPNSLKTSLAPIPTPLSLEDAKRAVAEFVEYYNNERLHSAIRYVTPKDKLEGHSETILAERERKLDAARQKRKQRRKERKEAGTNTDTHKDTPGHLTKAGPSAIMSTTGKTEAGSAGEQPARDSRLGYDEYTLSTSRGVEKTPHTLSHNGVR